MRTRVTHIAAVLLTATALSGCGTMHSIFGSNSRGAPELALPAQTAASPATEAEVERGRIHLEKGETGLAIEAFQRALSSATPPAAALNGLGVAYVRLGRLELAQRYFLEAIALDPLDRRFSANLTRLYNSRAFAMQNNAQVAATAQKSADLVEQSTKSGLSTPEPLPGQLARVSNRHFEIQTISPMSAPTAKIQSNRLVINSTGKITPEHSTAERSIGSGATMVRNPHLGKAPAVDARFQPIIRLKFARSGDQYRVLGD